MKCLTIYTITESLNWSVGHLYEVKSQSFKRMHCLPSVWTVLRMYCLPSVWTIQRLYCLLSVWTILRLYCLPSVWTVLRLYCLPPGVALVPPSEPTCAAAWPAPSWDLAEASESRTGTQSHSGSAPLQTEQFPVQRQVKGQITQYQ